MKNSVNKVSIFVIRKGACGQHDLLVFRHPKAGLQIPAGTIEVGEEPSAAAIREFVEETGLPVSSVKSKKLLYVKSNELKPGQGIMLEEATLKDVNGEDFIIKRGYKVKLINSVIEGSNVEIIYSELTPKSGGGFSEAVRAQGYVSRSILCTELRRYFYEFIVEVSVNNWNIYADGNDLFFFWANDMGKGQELVGLQNDWLIDFQNEIVANKQTE